MSLKAFRFRYDQTLEACLDGSHQLRVTSPVGPFETGRHVRKIQQSLQDLGFSLGDLGVDSVYGPDTASAVSAFKTQQQIFPNDGDVGIKTMTRLDALFADEVVFMPPAPGPGDLTVDDFLEAVQAAEGANPDDTPEEILTSIRQLYYPGTDPDGLTFREAFFDKLLPDAPFRFPDGTRRILTPAGMDPIFFGRLTQHAPENPTPGRPLDNPSPYLIDVTGARVDIGHVFLTIDALLHPRAGEPYLTWGVPAIDPASWVADVGIAAVWAEQNGVPDAPRVLPPLSDGQPDLDGYFKMSAPDADMLGDIDGFNIMSAWLAGETLSSVLIRYYMDGEISPGVYRQRFRTFMAGFFGTTDPDPTQLTDALITWRPRVDRFNDVFDVGPIGAFFTMTPPPPRQWIFTSDVIATFIQWLLDGERVEIDRFD